MFTNKILKGEQDLDVKIHIGGSFYLSANSPYKTIAIRVWKQGGTGQLFPTKLGISLSINFCKVGNNMYAEKMEIFTLIPCLMQSHKEGHNKLSCSECAENDQEAMGDIPI